MKKTLATLMAVALVGAAFVGPADAKKKKKKKPPVKVVETCGAYTPGDMGAEGETVVVTDAATEEAPVEVELSAAPGLRLGLDQTDAVTGGAAEYFNVQVDSAKPETGLYVRLEWSAPAPVWDYDMRLFNPDGSEQANAHGFNPDPEGPFAPVSDGGHSEGTAEQIDGVKTADCQGYTAEVTTASGPGGAMVLKYWLGDVQYDPAAAGE